MKTLILILALSIPAIAGQRVMVIHEPNRITTITPSKDTVFVIVDTPTPTKINWDSLPYWMNEELNEKKPKPDTIQEKFVKMQKKLDELSKKISDVDDAVYFMESTVEVISNRKK
jgi:hypothetical protein